MFYNICMEMEEMEAKNKRKFLGQRMKRMKANSRSNSLNRILGGMSSLNKIQQDL